MKKEGRLVGGGGGASGRGARVLRMGGAREREPACEEGRKGEREKGRGRKGEGVSTGDGGMVTAREAAGCA